MREPVHQHDQRDARLRAIAYHEAGHAVIAADLGVQIIDASLLATEHSLGRVRYAPLPTGFDPSIDDSWTTRRLLEPRIQVSQAGAIAERRGTGRRRNWTGAASDFEAAALAAVYCCGSEKQMRLYLAWLSECTKARVEFRWSLIAALADVLLDRQTMTSGDILATLGVGIPRTSI